MSIQADSLLEVGTIVAPEAAFCAQARIGSVERYRELYRQSVEAPEAFWAQQARELLHWHTPFTQVLDWQPPRAKWFADGKLNISYNCLDRHLRERANKPAIIWIGEPGDRQVLSYAQLHDRVARFAAGLSKLGVRAGDRVAVYMPMLVDAAVAMLACTRIGAVHSVVFGGFSAESLSSRILDAGAAVLITADGCYRRGNPFGLGAIVDDALARVRKEQTDLVRHVICQKRIGEQAPTAATHSFDQVVALGAQGMDAVALAAEHPSFILYTSGTTGKPKGIQHSTAGYLLGATISARYVFDFRESDIFWCTADVGWITGHSYTLYGALSNGATTVLYEGTPNTPDWGRFWQIVEQERITILYTAPTAIRSFMKAGDAWPAKYDLSSLRLLGSVGEPINPAAWQWYHQTIGGGRCPVVDTWWQTETGSIAITTLPGAHSCKPGSAGFPFFGIVPAVVDGESKPMAAGEGGFLLLTQPWPSMARTIWGDHDRFVTQYWSQYPGRYTTGDGAIVDADGFHWLLGRVDDVINCSGHRIGTMEVESVLVGHPGVAEAAVIGRDHELKGQALACFVVARSASPDIAALRAALRERVAVEIGRFAAPDDVFIVPAVPKTRSGKIMRRVLRAIAEGREIGDVTTLDDPATVQTVAALASEQRAIG